MAGLTRGARLLCRPGPPCPASRARSWLAAVWGPPPTAPPLTNRQRSGRAGPWLPNCPGRPGLHATRQVVAVRARRHYPPLPGSSLRLECDL